jgi:hypothetical protein
MHVGNDCIQREDEFGADPGRHDGGIVADRKPHVISSRTAIGEETLDQLELTGRHASRSRT